MDSIGELKAQVNRIGATIDAGQRGPAIGGELLVVFAIAFLPLAVAMVISSYGILLGYASFSPLAALAGFLSFLFVARNKSLPARLGLAVLAALIGQALWFGPMIALETADPALQAIRMLYVVGLPLATLAGVALAVTRLRSAPGALSPANRAIIACWLAIIAAAAVLVASFAATGFVFSNFFGFMLIPSALLALWGAGWAASGWISGRRWMGLVAIGAFALALYYAASFEIFGTLIVALVLLVLAPGVKLMRDTADVADRVDEA